MKVILNLTRIHNDTFQAEFKNNSVHKNIQCDLAYETISRYLTKINNGLSLMK